MGLRKVRRDPDAEQILAEIGQTSGLSIAEALTQGLLALWAQCTTQMQRTPYDIYAGLDLGDSGTALAPSTETRRGVRAALQRKHGRWSWSIPDRSWPSLNRRTPSMGTAVRCCAHCASRC